MPVTDDQIDGLEKQLESLVKKIQPLRDQVADLEGNLAQAQRDYDRELGALNAEASRLQGRKMALSAAMVGRPAPPPPPPSPPPPPPDPPPSEVDYRGATPLLPVREDPRAGRKRALSNHLNYFLNPDRPDPDPEQIKTIQAIHAMVKDEQREVGEMLEVLAWGDIWKVRTDWETLEDQARRLDEWRIALQQRLEYWERARVRLERDPRHGLLKEMQKGSQPWQAYLRGIAEQQQIENQRLARDISILEEEWRVKQAARQHNEP